MTTSKLILTAEVTGLGSSGDTVEVKGGYARNYLLPRGLAIQATRGAEKQVDSLRRMDGADTAPQDPRWRVVAAKHAVIARQTRRLATLADSLLDASRIQAGKLQLVPEQVDLAGVIAGALLAFQEDARLAGSPLQLAVGGRPVDLSGPARESIEGRWDPRRLEQVVRVRPGLRSGCPRAGSPRPRPTSGSAGRPARGRAG